jgi:hypothetical protein
MCEGSRYTCLTESGKFICFLCERLILGEE